ncbi:MAG: hypothetical protein A2511_16040 [Deltaproteobacteria bacterium RIFOXYD12_FULL_50_9]|nr:MAG: hypothetical protein A2511_16040 [Deltaproteobacteria bacterium RIFOXYD12_FULL_50_9]
MRLNLFMSKSSNLFAENRLLKICLIIITVITIFNTFMISKALRATRTILVPANMDRKVEFIEGKPTEEYVAQLGRNLSTLGLSFSPATARSQFGELLKYYTPSAYPAAYRMWYTLASRVEEAKVSQVFYLRSLKLNTNSNQIELIGDKRQYTDEKMIKGDELAHYVISYQITNGKFELLSFLDKSQQKEKGYVEVKQNLDKQIGQEVTE